MPRSTFANGLLRGSTPGLSKLAAALTTGDQAYQEGYDAQDMLRSKLAQAMAAARSSDAQAQHYTAQSNELDAKRRVLESRPDVYNEQAALASGLDVPTVQAYRERVRTGVAPSVPMGPPDESGGMGAGPLVLPQQAQSKLAASLQQLAPMLLNSGDLKPDDLAQAAQIFRGMGLSDAIIGGQANRNTVAGAQAAAKGDGLYKQDGTGAVLDQFTGDLDASNPLAQATIKQRQQYGDAAVTRANRPAAAGQRGVIRDTAEGLMLIDPVTGDATPVSGGGGQPVLGKTSDKPMTEGQAKANLFGNRMLEADKIINDTAGKFSINGLNAKMYGESIPGIGGLVGLAGNSMLSEDAQKAEQAQRDFINAVLRRESGAVISDGEFVNARKQYFPQPGDKREVILQKAANRQRAIELMLAEVPQQHRNAQQAATAPSPAAVGGGERVVPKATQQARDTDRMAILQQEYAKATRPEDRQAIASEIQRMGGKVLAVPAPASPASAPTRTVTVNY